MLTRLARDVNAALAIGGRELLSVAPAWKAGPRPHGWPAVLRSHQLLSSSLCKDSALPKSSVSLFTAAVYEHRGNQNERAIADTLNCPVPSRKNGALGSSGVVPPPLASLCRLPAAVHGHFQKHFDQTHVLNSFGAIFAVCFSVLEPTAVTLSIILYLSQLPLKTESRSIHKPHLSEGITIFIA